MKRPLANVCDGLFERTALVELTPFPRLRTSLLVANFRGNRKKGNDNAEAHLKPRSAVFLIHTRKSVLK
jgi:hypothetical protein